jgi:hypothetical protein
VDAGTDDRARAPRDGLVVMGARSVLAGGLLLLVAVSLATGIGGGLLRAGALPLHPGPLLAHAAAAHAALMMSGFLGTVIGVERAVALRRPAAFVAPLASGAGAILLLFGQSATAALALVSAALVFAFANVLVVRRQPAVHTALLLIGALAWLAGNLCLAWTIPGLVTPAWWFVFLVTTIAAERLELTRLMPRQPRAQALLLALIGTLVVAAGLSSLHPVGGGVLFGAALCALAFWLAAFDVVRRTIRTHGISRYMAISLLVGYAWLAIGGIAWAAHSLGLATRDAALHALGLGFIFSMVMAHAPVILPAITALRLRFRPAFYLPVVLLNASLLLRLGNPSWRGPGAAFNAMAIAVFAAVLVVGVLDAGGARALPPRVARGS